MNNTGKKIWNRDLIYSLVFIALAWITLLHSISITDIFGPILDISLIAKVYLYIYYIISKIGIYTDPISLLFSYVLPFIFSIAGICFSVKWGLKIETQAGKRKFFGFIPIDKRGILLAALILIGVLNILFVVHLFLDIAITGRNIFEYD